jgi:hypothetical protein
MWWRSTTAIDPLRIFPPKGTAFDSILHFFIPKEKVEEIREKIDKADRGEPEASVTSIFSSSFYGAFRRRLVLRGGSLVTWAGGGKKRLIRLQVLPYRSFFTGLIRPVSQYLWECTCRRTSVGAGGGLVACRFFLQGRTYRSNYPYEEKPVGKCRCWLLRPFHTAGRPLRPAPRGIPWQVYLWVCTCQSLPVERRLK